jgi:hypothetical protein
VADAWIELEDGVRVAFGPGHDRSGDYWTIPARWETGDAVWPADVDGQPVAREPEGVTYLYAPLAYVQRGGKVQFDLRCVFPTLGCKETGGALSPPATDTVTPRGS